VADHVGYYIVAELRIKGSWLSWGVGSNRGGEGVGQLVDLFE
jgi:hypothetical protein